MCASKQGASCAFSGLTRFFYRVIGEARPEFSTPAFAIVMLVEAVSLSTHAASAWAQTLTEALAYSYNNNPQLLAQRALLRSTDENVPQALSNWRPTVTFTGQAGVERGVFATPTAPTAYSTFEPRSLDLRVVQPVYRGGRTEAQTRQAV